MSKRSGVYGWALLLVLAGLSLGLEISDHLPDVPPHPTWHIWMDAFLVAWFFYRTTHPAPPEGGTTR